MKHKATSDFSGRAVLPEAFKYSVPVLLGYVTVGIAFGFMVTKTGYPWWLALVMSVWMFAGAGQFIALGLFSVGTSLWQICLIQLVVNVRHVAYGLSMLKSFRGLGLFKPYLVFSLTDETFALLSSIKKTAGTETTEKKATEMKTAGTEVAETYDSGEVMGQNKRQHLFMIYVAALNHFYWVAGSVAGALAGTIIPFDMKGVSFALTALFVVLMIEQIKRVKKPGIIIVSAIAALAGVYFLPQAFSILAALGMALLLAPLLKGKRREQH